MAPPSFTKGKVALLDPLLIQARGKYGSDVRSVPCLGMYREVGVGWGWGEGDREINLEEKETRWCSDRGDRGRQSETKSNRAGKKKST